MAVPAAALNPTVVDSLVNGILSDRLAAYLNQRGRK
jgi:hypothetical protein